MLEGSPAELKYQVARQREEIQTINEVGRILRSTLNTQRMIGQVSSYLRQAFPLALCGVLLPNQRKLHLVRFAPISPVDATNAVRQILKDANEKIRHNLSEEEVAPVIEDQFGASSAGPVSEIRSHLSIPLTIENGTAGLLSLFSAKAKAFGDQELRSIEIVADQFQAALRNALLVEKLQEADLMKNELLSVISHELRIPLTVIREGVSLLFEEVLGPVNPEQKDFLATVRQNVERLRLLLDKVLTATQVITGKLSLSLEQTDLNQMLEQLETTFRVSADAKKVQLERSGERRELRWKADRNRLKESLAQILENAIQVTEAGGKVSFSLAAQGNTAEIVISDTGRGIPPDEIPRLFDSFRSIGGIHERKTGGLGLGLFIGKAIVEAHGGTIRVESVMGKGSRFTISLKAP